ncbi:MAG: hypothetical protein M1365_15245 [Actinobacteria bacterium]|nr:hypothetical protein [Actinomycetota bacterium]
MKSKFYATLLIADKADKSSELIDILNEINKICFKSVQFQWGDQTKKLALIELLKNKNVKLKIPCLLAYTENIYSDEKELSIKINKCVVDMVNTFDQTDFNIINELEYELVFCIFPLSDVKELRKKIVEFKKAGV